MEIESKIKTLLKQTLSKPSIKDEVNFLMSNLKITEDELLASWILWDTSIKKYSNEVYKSESLRMVMHLHNYQKGSWHEKRQDIVLKFINKVNFKSICEIGFGTPQKYVKEFLSRDVKILLTDYEQSSIYFAKQLLQYWNNQWKLKVHLDIFDLDIDLLPNNYDTYIFQDSIEHSQDPTRTLQRFVNQASKGSYFIFSLPIEIENPIPEHHIYWTDKKHVLSWLEYCGLTIIESNQIFMNKDVDIYSLSLHKDFSELIVLAKKNYS